MTREKLLSAQELYLEYGLGPTWLQALRPRWCPEGPRYPRSEVEAFLVEHHREYRRMRLAPRARRARRRLLRRAKAELRRWARRVDLGLAVPAGDLGAMAKEHYRLMRTAGIARRTGKAPRGRGAVLAMLRHRHSDYDRLLASTRGRYGHEKAAAILRERAIREAAERLGLDLDERSRSRLTLFRHSALCLEPDAARHLRRAEVLPDGSLLIPFDGPMGMHRLLPHPELNLLHEWREKNADKDH